MAAIESMPALARRTVASDAILNVSTRAARRRALWNVLQRTGKTTDGFVARHLNRPLSRLVSFLLLSLGLRASHASALALVVGAAAAFTGAFPGYWPLVGCGVLFHLASVLDGVDGELARATLTESDAGARLDILVDNLTHFGCLAAVTLGWMREGGEYAVVLTGLVIIAALWTVRRGNAFASRHAPHAPKGRRFAFIHRSIDLAARESGDAVLRLAAPGFHVLNRDLFALLFLAVSLTGRRALIPVLVACGLLFANFVLSRYRQELSAAAAVEALSLG
jgi:CDP-L-myo-inositol myo-inositolphosphotransferase